MRTRCLLALSIAVLASASCKRAPLNPAAFNRQKLALATWYGNTKILTSGAGLIAAGQAGAADWGKELLDAAYPDEFEGRLQKIVGGSWTPGKSVIETKAYASLPAPTFASSYYAPGGMRPVRMDAEEGYPLLSSLAKEVGAEAVAGVQTRWNVYSDEKGQYCQVDFTFTLVDAEGQRLFDFSDSAEARAEDSWKQAGMEALGAASPDNVKQMCRDATRRALDRFGAVWGESKIEAANQPPPAAKT